MNIGKLFNYYPFKPQYDAEERKICEKIVKGRGFERSLPNILEDTYNLDKISIEGDRSSQILKIKFEMTVGPKLDEYEQQAIELLAQSLEVLERLEDEKMIIPFDRATIKTNEIFMGRRTVNIPCYSMTVGDTSIKNRFFKYADKELMATTKLKRLKERQYLTNEQIDRWNARGLGLLAIAATIMTSMVATSCSEKVAIVYQTIQLTKL